MWPASSHKRPYGALALGRGRRRSGRGADDLRSCCDVMASINRSQLRSLRLVCQWMLGARSRGVRGRAERLSSRFARVRIRAAHRDYWLAESRPEEWLLIEWPEGEEAPTKYWFSTLPANIGF